MAQLDPNNPIMADFREKTWADSLNSFFLDKLDGMPYDPHYLEIVWDDLDLRGGYAGKCRCTSSCQCAWTPEMKQVPCVCGRNDAECAMECEGCDRALNEGKNDNRQNGIKGVNCIKTTVIDAGYPLGKSLVADEPFKKGDALVRFTGHVIRDSHVREDESRYALDVGAFTIRVKRAWMYNNQGDEHTANWVMVSTVIGSNANRAKESCSNNNCMPYIVFINGLPHPVLYALKDGVAGLSIFYFIMLFLNVVCIFLVNRNSSYVEPGR